SVEGALAQTDRLARLVEGLLSASTAAMGRFELDRSELDLADVIRRVVGDCRADAEATGTILHVETIAARGLWDGNRMYEVMHALIANAIKFAAGTTVEVTLRPRGEGSVRLMVRDGGAGISAEDLPRMFGRYEKAVSSQH